MKPDSILLLTKDAQCKAYYPPYGNKYWKGKMPNYEELAAKGTIFDHFYTAAPSSNMSYLSMFTMKYPYEHEIKAYVYLPQDYTGETLFNLLAQKGYSNHIMWDDSWDPDIKYARCYGGCTIHSIKDLRQGVGCHYEHTEPLVENEKVALDTFNRFKAELETIVNTDETVFIWCHLPHVLNGRVGYGGDMDLYDKYIGLFREYFDDNNIFISADHGNMNGQKGKVCYGFDVYQPNICIPFISPRINGLNRCDTNLVNIDLHEIILNRTIPQREYVVSDSAYYAQPRRKTAIVLEKYIYIFNKESGKEELYDINWDPNQNFNLMDDNVYDTDRHVSSLACEYYFYPHWNELPPIREKARKIKNSFWREETQLQKTVAGIRGFLSRHKKFKKFVKEISFYKKWR